MNAVQIKIEGMTDMYSAADVLRKLAAVPGVRCAQVALDEATVEGQNLPPDLLLGAITAAGNYQGEIIPRLTATLQEKPPQHLLQSMKKSLVTLFMA